jgi:hypothetical protein
LQVAQHSFKVQGAHFVLILYICALSSSSHLAALITLRKYFRRYKLIAKIRLGLVVVFALFLLCSMIAAIAMPTEVVTNHDGVLEKQHRVQRLSFIVPMIFIIFGFSTALVCILYRPPKAELTYRRSSSSGRSTKSLLSRCIPRKVPITFTLPGYPSQFVMLPANFGLRLLYYLVLNPLIAFTIQIVLASLSVILVLSQKFAVPDDKTVWCGLQDSGENIWGFGQTLSVVMLLLPAMSAAQTYLEGRQDIQDGKNSGD